MEIKNLSVDIIIPVYNCRNFIDRCLKSILDQKCQEKLRIILVDDGSTDGSSKIVDNYADNFQNIIAIHKKNGGLSSARNAGLKLVKSDYFTFVDSDDWIEKDYMQKVILELLNNSADILMVPYIRKYEEKNIENFFFGRRSIYFNYSETRNFVLKRLYGLTNEQLSHPLRIDNISTAWGKFYKSKKFSEITFKDKSEIYSEDLYFNIRCFLKAQNSEYFTEVNYIYFKGNSASIVHTYDPKMLDEYKNLYKIMKSFIVLNNLNGQFKHALNNRIVINELSILRNVSISKLSFLNKRKIMKKIMNDRIYKIAYLNFDIDKLPFYYRSFYLGCKFKMTTYVLLILHIGEKLKTRIKQ